MILQSHVRRTNGVYEIELLPALPQSWGQGHVTGLRARGGFEVEMAWSGGVLQQAKITSLLGNPLCVRLGDRVVELRTQRGQQFIFDSNLQLSR